MNLPKVAIVGLGALGGRIIRHMSMEDSQNSFAILEAVCDPASGRAKSFAEQYNVSKYYTDYEELLKDESIDIVTLCTPIGMHYSQGMAAIRAGKHVHFNKTFAVTVEQADELIAVANENDIKLYASPANMLWPFNQRKRKLILEGKIGKVVWAAGSSFDSASYHINEKERHQKKAPEQNADPTWYFQKNGGGPLYDSTVYAIHSMTGILGPAKSVIAVSDRMRDFFVVNEQIVPNEMDDSVMMILTFEGGTHGLISAAPTKEPLALGGQSCVFYGLNGYIDENGLNGHNELKFEGDHMPHHIGKHGGMYECHVYEDVMQLADWVRTGERPNIPSVEHARHVIEIIEAAQKSAEIGKMVELQTTFDAMTLDQINESLSKFGGNGPTVQVPQFGSDYEYETKEDIKIKFF